ncbi:MAG TPA: ABC transporter ATP-binding protein [bacterium]|mgnify:CR=1 FL=1|nr:ABC transporter ATP-binding protein [bacterium]HPN43032.1 ABC transporter ATP-binding protein [bacterium]
MKEQEEELTGKAYDSRLMKRLLQFIRPYKIQMALALLFLVIFAFCELLGPYLIKIAIDSKIATGDMHGLLIITLIFLLVLIIQFIVNYMYQYLTQWLGQHIMYDIRNQIFTHVLKLPLSFFNKNPVGRLVTRLTNDVEALNEMLSSGLVAIFGDLVVLIGIVIVMLNLNWQLALITFAIMPFIFYASWLFRVKVRDSFRKVRLRIARINSFLQENISGMSIVQLFLREKKNYKHFDELNKSHLDAHLETIRYFAIFFPAIELLSSVALALILWYGGFRIYNQTLTIGVVVAFIQYAQRFFQPIRDLSDKYNIMQAAMASSERIFILLDSPEQQNTLKEPTALKAVTGKIEFKNVTFSYNGDEQVLKNISFTVHPGEKVAIVGATGSGKTTLTNLITRMYELQQGQIMIDDVDIAAIPVNNLRKMVGMVQQDNFIFADSIHDNITLGNDDITPDKVAAAARNVNAHHFINKLPDRFDYTLFQRGGNISVGQKQLVAFARALAYDPHILIMDEATSSVDTETELWIRDATNKLMTGRTAIIIAHRLSTIQNVDKIIVLHKGEIREMGAHAELLKKRGIYYRLYRLQFKNTE